MKLWPTRWPRQLTMRDTLVAEPKRSSDSASPHAPCAAAVVEVCGPRRADIGGDVLLTCGRARGATRLGVVTLITAHAAALAAVARASLTCVGRR